MPTVGSVIVWIVVLVSLVAQLSATAMSLVVLGNNDIVDEHKDRGLADAALAVSWISYGILFLLAVVLYLTSKVGTIDRKLAQGAISQGMMGNFGKK